MDLQPGQTFDRYTVDKLLGRGGMAVVYRVVHTQLGSFHALKILTVSSPGIRQRLLQEGRVQASLRHPNIVAVTDVLDIQGQPGLVIEYVDGPSMDRWLQDHRLPLEEAEALFRGIVQGVQAAHAQGLVHRDLKPANVMLQPASGQWIPKVADFGLAKALVDEGEGMARTRSGVTMGTPQYMAPEQIRDAKNVDARADVFSLGCILFELVTGHPPFNGPDVLSIFNAVASASYEPPETIVPDLPPRVQNAIRGCLTVDRDARIPDCATLLQVLGGAAPSRPAASRPAVSSPPSRGGSETFVAEDFAGMSSQVVGGGLQSAVPAARPSPTVAPPVSSVPSFDGTISPASSPSIDTPAPRRKGRLLAMGFGAVALMGGAAVLVVLVAIVGVVWFQGRQTAIVADLAARTGGEMAYGAVTVRPKGIRVEDVVLTGSDGAPVLTIDAVTLEGNPATIAAGAVDAVRLEGVKADLRPDADGWVLPDQTLAALRGGAAARVGELSTGAVEVVWHGADGDLGAEWSDLVLTGAAIGGDGLWRADAVALSDLDVSAAEPVVRAKKLTMDADGAVRADGLDVWVRSRTDGLFDVPPVIGGRVVDWLGGSAPSVDGEWYGLDPAALPGEPVRFEASNGTLRVLDRANAVKGVEWVVALDRASAGPLSDGALPLSLAGRSGEGRLQFDGDLRADGLLKGRLAITHLPLADLGPYLESSLRAYGVTTSGGTLKADLDLVVKEASFAAVLDAEIADPVFTATPNAPADAARKGKKLLQKRAKVEIDKELQGSLADLEFTPVNGLLQAVVDKLLAPAGGAVWEKRKVEPKPRDTTTTTRRRPDAPPPGSRAGAAEEPRAEDPSASVETRPEESRTEAPAEEPVATAPAETPPADDPLDEKPKDALDRVNREVRDALDDLRLPRGNR